MVRNLGRSAEKRFGTLCSDLGITCNPAIEDDHGWDHIVQFQHETIVGVSADMQSRLPAVFVQTKSHEADGLTVTLTLSNAVKLATSPNPCFVALATLPAGSDVATWHAVHVWGELLERILRRAREESRDGTSEDDFNKKTFSLTMTKADLHHGQSILPWMAQTVRRIGADYAAVKAAIVPPPSLVGEIKIGPLSSIDELIDHTIGLTSDIPVQGFEIGARRLGVDIPLPSFVPEGATYRASMQAHPVATADIRMRGPDGTIVDLVADVIVPPNLGLPADSYRYRFRAANLDIVWSPSGAATIRGHFDGHEKTSPAELVKTLSFVRWAGKGDIDVRVTVEDEVALGATARMDALPDQDHFADIAELALPLALVSRHLRTKVPAVSIADVAQAQRIGDFHRFINATEMRLAVELHEPTAIPDFTAGIAFAAVQVGDWVFAGIQRFPLVSQSRTGGRWTAEFGKPLLLEPFAFSTSDADALKRFKNDYRRLASAPGVLALDNALNAMPADAGVGDAQTTEGSDPN
ncbi:hypothetical protein KX816_04925 [Sphingosinicellaceae bacterium]|nr:hypothetical protein KX816_04925 [Sphingosinicellaceae bacterium]